MNQSALVVSDVLLEREHEVERVRAAVRAVGQRAGAVVVIEGPAGMGKSRLLEVARVRATELGLRVLSARATELEQGFPFDVMRQLFERAMVEADPGQRERWLAGAAALAADLLTTAPTPSATSRASAPPAADSSYAWQHGLYWLASNLAVDSPMVIVVDDLQWCDAPSARALAFIARRLEGQPLGLILATRPLDPGLTPDAATLVGDPAADVLRPSALTEAAIGALVSDRLSGEADDRFVRACLDATRGNPFLVGELLSEAAARGIAPISAEAGEIATIVPRGVSNSVLLRLARLGPHAGALARALSILGDGGQIGDAARLSGLSGRNVEAGMAALVAAAIVEPGGTVRFTHPILRSAIYGDLSPAERERLHQAAAGILREREAPVGQVAAHLMRTEPAADGGTVVLLRDAARAALALGDAAGAAALLARALREPPTHRDRSAVVLELGQAYARAGAPEAIEPLSEVVERGEDPASIAEAAIELSGMYFYGGRAAEGAAILRRAQARLPASGPARERLEVALLGLSYSSVSARREADAEIANLRDPGGPARGSLQATTLATLALDEVMYLRSASTATVFAHRALAEGLPLEPHRGENWTLAALFALMFSDHLDAAGSAADEILARARERGAAVTVVAISTFRAYVGLRRGDLAGAQADAQTAIDLAPDLLGAEFLVPAVSTAVLAGLERDETPDALRGLIGRTGVRFDPEFTPSAQLLYASGVLRAAAGNHHAAVEELHGCALDHPVLGGENPAVMPWRSAAALSLTQLDRDEEARALAAEEVRRAQSFGAPRAMGIAQRAQALVGPAAGRAERLDAAREVLATSPARLEHARVLVDLGATLRAAGQRTAAREPLLEGLALAARCGARALERRSRAELAAVGVRPRSAEHAGADSLTPSERRVVELAAAGGTNREIAQGLFVTEKTVETHLGRAFRKLDISSRRQLPDVVAHAAG